MSCLVELFEKSWQTQDLTDAVLLGQEDHSDNLDEPGRLLLDGRHVFTTLDGAKKLGPGPSVRGLHPWETVQLQIGSKHLDITGTPCKHLPGGEVNGFIITAPEFRETKELPNAIYFSGDTVYFDELVEIRNKFHISVAVLDIGKVMISLPDQELQITMDSKDAARLLRDIGVDVPVPMHHESWRHFTENGTELHQAFEEEGIMDKVYWLTPGQTRKIV
jgi:L-ascorbate metabolism protein UlaG (beta-lactamase superfamily)